MLKIIYSNDLTTLAQQLNQKLKSTALDPFYSDTILIQSQGMARWLNLELASENGVCANINFELFSSFLWKQYSANFFSQELSEAKDWFNLESMHWLTFMELKNFLDDVDFTTIKQYLASHQENQDIALFELSRKIANIFDELLVYRPDWIRKFNQQDSSGILEQIINNNISTLKFSEIQQNELLNLIKWQIKLWQAVSKQLYKINPNSKNRADLFFSYIELLQQQKPKNLPPRLFVFGINALTNDQLNILNLMAQYIEINLFFHNPCQYFWGDIKDDRQISQIKLKNAKNLRNTDEYYENHPLLASFGKLGRDFFAAIQQLDYFDEEEYYQENQQSHLLAQIKNSILNLQPQDLELSADDRSIQIHSCYSPMREVMALHDYLLNLFLTRNGENNQEYPSLAPRDIMVMLPDIDKYKPYIDAVFSQYKYSFNQNKADKRFLDYAVSDHLLINQDPVINSFMTMLVSKNNKFDFDSVWDLLTITSIHTSFDLTIDDLGILKIWLEKLNLGAGLEQNESDNIVNFSSWETALNRILLGTAIREQDGLWHNLSAFDDAYGLSSLLAGKLYEFITELQKWQSFVNQAHNPNEWHQFLTAFCYRFYRNDEDIVSLDILLETLDKVFNAINNVNYTQDLSLEIIHSVLSQEFKQEKKTANFLIGKINFCTMLPMRAIPFDTICLLGMGDGHYPRDYPKDSFNLLNYNFQYGDRVRRDDDFYLFLEAILSAKNNLYISYVGRSIKSNESLEPSILVSELLRYIEQNLSDKSAVATLCSEHCLSPFNLENFNNLNKSWAYEWLGLNNETEKDISENSLKSVAMNTDLAPSQNIELDLNDLASFIAQPLVYFFNKNLSIRQPDFNTQANSEIIIADGLEQYKLLSDYVKFAAENNFSTHKMQLQQPQFIAEKQAQAKLGVANVGVVNFNNIIKERVKFYQKLSGFYNFDKAITSFNFNYEFAKDNKIIHLTANIHNIKEQTQYSFYTSSLKNKYIINAYILALIGIISEKFNEVRLNAGKDSEVVLKLETTPQQAQAKLDFYLETYLTAQTQPLVCVGFNRKHAIADLLYKLFKPSDGHDDSEILQQKYYWTNLYCNSTIEEFLLHNRSEIELNYANLYSELIEVLNKPKPKPKSNAKTKV